MKCFCIVYHHFIYLFQVLRVQRVFLFGLIALILNGRIPLVPLQ